MLGGAVKIGILSICNNFGINIVKAIIHRTHKVLGFAVYRIKFRDKICWSEFVLADKLNSCINAKLVIFIKTRFAGKKKLAALRKIVVYLRFNLFVKDPNIRQDKHFILCKIFIKIYKIIKSVCFK